MFLAGLLLAYDVYRPVFSATSHHIVGTIRDNEQFLWICTGVWAVGSLLRPFVATDNSPLFP
jgi:very-long-chain enoyl-CoA reductase